MLTFQPFRHANRTSFGGKERDVGREPREPSLDSDWPRNGEKRDCCVHIYADTCLQHNIPDQAVTLCYVWPSWVASCNLSLSPPQVSFLCLLVAAPECD